MNRDLIAKTQEAIDKASVSVNESLNAARKSREKAMRDKAKERLRVVSQWKNESLEAKQFYEDSEKSRRKQLMLRRQLSSQASQAKASWEVRQRQKRLKEIDRESQFKSEVFREHRERLEEDMARKKRESMMARAKIRENNQQGTEKLRLMKIDEDQAIFEERSSASDALRKSKRSDAEKRRKSYQFRNGDARRIREIHEEMEEERKRIESQSYELKFEADKDAEEYKRELADQRRSSLAMRNQVAREQVVAAQIKKKEESDIEHENYELKAAAHRDAVEYKKRLNDERRESLASRNQNAKKQREQICNKQQADFDTEHESYLLKWEAEKDAEAYKKQLEYERRNSIATRNKEAQRRQYEKGQEKTEKMNEQHESYELKRQADKDVEAYKRKMEKERRESLAARNAEAKRRHDQEDAERKALMAEEHESYELKWNAERDTDEYKKRMEDERRESLASRNETAKLHRDIEKQQERDRVLERQQDAELKWAGGQRC